jgi:hypothetical protein
MRHCPGIPQNLTFKLTDNCLRLHVDCVKIEVHVITCCFPLDNPELLLTDSLRNHK